MRAPQLRPVRTVGVSSEAHVNWAASSSPPAAPADGLGVAGSLLKDDVGKVDPRAEQSDTESLFLVLCEPPLLRSSLLTPSEEEAAQWACRHRVSLSLHFFLVFFLCCSSS